MNWFKAAALASAAMSIAAYADPAVAQALGKPATTEAEQQAATSGQEADATQSGLSNDEIVVTAQRREERIQDIPIAVSAFGGEQLARSGVVSIENIAPRVPSFYFGSFGALRPQLYIRGIGTRSFDPGSESSVGVFEDEVYLGRSSGSFGALKDIERVEVLRGPQGTLYGRNTIGGAINIITKGPTPSFEASAEAGVSNFNGWEVFGALGGPISSDKSLMFRVAGWHTERDGYVTNLVSGKKFQGVDNTGARLRLAFEPTNDLRIDLTGEYMHDGDAGAFGGVNQGTSFSAAGAPPNPRAVFFAAGSRLSLQRQPVSLREAYLSFDPYLDRDAYSAVGRIEANVGFATLTAISAYRKLDVQDGRDLEGSSLAIIDQLSDETSEQFTQEVRLTSDPDGALSFGGALDWILGGFYYRDTSTRTDSFNLGIDSAVRAAIGTAMTDTGFSDYKITSFAFFGQATLHLREALDITLGGRYTRDKKRARQTGTTTDALPLIAANFDVTNGAVYESFDPRIVLSYKFSSDVNVYASYSTGFKSGGFQYIPFNATVANNLFEPEDIKAFEVGFKSEWLDRRVRLNVAGYYYDYKNLQVSRIVDTAAGPQTIISNAASSKVKGVDVELLMRPSDHFDVSLTYGYLDARYDKYIFNVGQNLNFNDTKLVRAPDHSLNAAAEWRIPLTGETRLTLRADYALLDTFYHEPGQGRSIYGSGIPLTREEGYGLLDLRATVDLGRFRVTGYVTNAFDTEYRRTVNALGSTIVGFAGTPRMYGLRLSANY